MKPQYSGFADQPEMVCRADTRQNLHLIGALASIAAVPTYVMVFGQLGFVEWAALSWLLISSIIVSMAPRLGLSIKVTEVLSLANMSILVTFLALFTGGTRTFLIAWFFVIPIEAILLADRRTFQWALGFVSAAIVVVLGTGWLDILPAMQQSAFITNILFAGSTFFAFVYLGALVIVSKHTDWAAETSSLQNHTHDRYIADNALDVIVRQGANGVVKYVSAACRSVTGYTVDEIKENSDPLFFVHPDDRSAVQAVLREARHFGKSATLEFRVLHKDGHYVWVETRCNAVAEPQRITFSFGKRFLGRLLKLNDANKSNYGEYEVVAIARDISETREEVINLRKAWEEAEAANLSKSRFLANISHELRTPLNAIIGFSDVMHRQMFGRLGNARYQEYAGLINMSGGQLLELINDLLDMSKIEAGKYEIDRTRVFFPIVIEECLRLMRLQADKAKVRLAIDLPNYLPHIQADRRACRQILLNLLSNAIKFTPAGGKITIGARVVDEQLLIEVSDTGVGIPHEDLERLGQPFEQVSSDGDLLRKKNVGTGLGLALVRSLTDLHHGHIDIASRIGIGTTIGVYLPVNEELPEEHQHSQSGAKEAANDHHLQDDQHIVLEELDGDIRDTERFQGAA